MATNLDLDDRLIDAARRAGVHFSRWACPCNDFKRARNASRRLAGWLLHSSAAAAASSAQASCVSNAGAARFSKPSSAPAMRKSKGRARDGELTSR